MRHTFDVFIWISVAVAAWVLISIIVAIVMARVISHADLEAEAADLRALQSAGRARETAGSA
jgi:heme exporter protein D